MLKNFKSIILVMSMLLSTVMCFSQSAARSLADLISERGQLQEKYQSAEATEREEKLYKLLSKPPKDVEVKSVDGLAETATGALRTVSSANDVLEKYKIEVRENGDGDIDITKHAANLKDYVQLSLDLADASLRIADGTKKIQEAQKDVQALNPLKAKPALSSVKFSTEALKVAGEEIALQVKLVNNLIESIKASKNL
jgi:hypothetical protein